MAEGRVAYMGPIFEMTTFFNGFVFKLNIYIYIILLIFYIH